MTQFPTYSPDAGHILLSPEGRAAAWREGEGRERAGSAARPPRRGIEGPRLQACASDESSRPSPYPLPLCAPAALGGEEDVARMTAA